MEALRKLLYAEMSREEYKACLPDIQRSNRQRVTAYLGIACAFLTVLWILSGALEFLRPNMPAYMIALAVCMGLQAVNRAFPGKNGLLLTWLMYAFEALLYVLGIYLGIHPSPDTPTVSFIAFLLAVPLLFVMRPIQHILNVVFFDGVFILTCFLFKSKETLPVDILDGMVFGAVSCIISTFIMLSMHENFSIRHKLLGIAGAEVARLQRLTEELLFLAGQDAHILRLCPEELEPDTFLLEVWEAWRAPLRQSGHELTLELPDEPFSPIRADKARLEQLFTILLHNAMEYTPPGTAIELAAGRKGAGVIFSVRDHGPGVPEKDRQRIFRRFARGEECRTGKEHFGLGLSIARQIAALHGGRLWVEDAPGGGAVFFLQLPAGR